jgi:hypothetical protein
MALNNVAETVKLLVDQRLQSGNFHRDLPGFLKRPYTWCNEVF